MNSSIRFDKDNKYFTIEDLRRDLDNLNFLENLRLSDEIEVYKSLLKLT
jgi:hypothetical protein